jgi:hypothetical protein
MLNWSARLEALGCGQALVRTAANLIVRFCPGLRLAPRTAFAKEVADLIVAIDSDAAPLTVPPQGSVHVHLGGGRVRAAVTGSSNGWLAYVSGRGEELPELVDSPNVLGAHAAAAFVAAEAFKHALPIRGQHSWHTPKTAYSVYEYGEPTGQTPEIGPVNLYPAPLLAGVGAVGQACVDTLISARTTGELRVVDRGFLDDETNLNRSVVAVENDVLAMTPKVALAVRHAEGSGLRILPHRLELAELIRAVEARQIPWPSVIAAALDNLGARRDLQGLWPDLLFEGATGDTMVQIFRHSFDEGLACLRCLHGLPVATQNYEEVMSSRTGISPAEIARALRDTSVKLTKEMAAKAPDEVKEIAHRHEGADVCGYLRDIEHYFGVRTEAPVLVSVSFASYLAGVFLAAEILKRFAGIPTLLTSRYQIDTVGNLTPERPFPQNKDPQCYCVGRAETTNEYRRLMRENRSDLVR